MYFARKDDRKGQIERPLVFRLISICMAKVGALIIISKIISGLSTPVEGFALPHYNPFDPSSIAQAQLNVSLQILSNAEQQLKSIDNNLRSHSISDYIYEGICFSVVCYVINVLTSNIWCLLVMKTRIGLMVYGFHSLTYLITGQRQDGGETLESFRLEYSKPKLYSAIILLIERRREHIPLGNNPERCESMV